MTAPTSGYPQLSLTPTLRQVVERVGWLFQGKRNSHSEVTLAAGAATTTLTDPLIGADCHITFTPTTANAGAAGVTYYTRAAGSATLHHANNANVDRTFTYDVAP